MKDINHPMDHRRQPHRFGAEWLLRFVTTHNQCYLDRLDPNLCLVLKAAMRKFEEFWEHPTKAELQFDIILDLKTYISASCVWINFRDVATELLKHVFFVDFACHDIWRDAYPFKCKQRPKESTTVSYRHVTYWCTMEKRFQGLQNAIKAVYCFRLVRNDYKHE